MRSTEEKQNKDFKENNKKSLRYNERNENTSGLDNSNKQMKQRNEQ